MEYNKYRILLGSHMSKLVCNYVKIKSNEIKMKFDHIKYSGLHSLGLGHFYHAEQTTFPSNEHSPHLSNTTCFLRYKWLSSELPEGVLSHAKSVADWIPTVIFNIDKQLKVINVWLFVA